MISNKQKEVVAIVKLKSRTDQHKANLSDDFQAMKNMVEQQKREELLDEWIKKKQKTTKKDETTTVSGSGNGRYNGRSGNATNDVDPNNPNSKTGKRNSSGISPKTGSNIIIPIAGLLVAAGAIVVSRKELTDKN